MTREGLVLSRVGGRYRVQCDGEVVVASLRGRVKVRSEEKVLVGDRVSLLVKNGDGATIEQVLPRRSVLQRRSPGRKSGVRTVAANLDQVVAVGAARNPDWDAHLMDRFLVVAEANHLPAVIVVNKADLDSAAAAALEPYRRAGYRTLVTSASRGDGVEALRGELARRVSLFSGPTGSGKSSLLNAIQPGLRLRTGEVSPRAGAGRHTTVSAEMHPLSGGGYVVDTPGLRDVGLWGLTAGDVADAFPEFRRYVGTCRFDNCRHVGEPDCAVIAAAGRADIAPERLDSYRRFLQEALAAARPWN
jgi:ribosome biogenesis GTPase